MRATVWVDLSTVGGKRSPESAVASVRISLVKGNVGGVGYGKRRRFQGPLRSLDSVALRVTPLGTNTLPLGQHP